MPIHDALRVLAKKARISLFVDPGITGSVTISARSMAWDEVLAKIAEDHALRVEPLRVNAAGEPVALNISKASSPISPRKEYAGAPIEVNFDDTPIRSVARTLSDFAEIDIVVDDDVEATITLHLRKIPWDNLRSRRSFRAVERALRLAADRFDVRITSFSVQGNHIHLLVEAASRNSLSRAIKGLSIRIAKGLNRMMHRQGRVLGDRYHAHVLRTPAEVKRAIRYIRDNARKHAAERGEIYSAGYVDPYSSAGAPHVTLPAAQTWLLREGWTRGSS